MILERLGLQIMMDGEVWPGQGVTSQSPCSRAATVQRTVRGTQIPPGPSSESMPVGPTRSLAAAAAA